MLHSTALTHCYCFLDRTGAACASPSRTFSNRLDLFPSVFFVVKCIFSVAIDPHTNEFTWSLTAVSKRKKNKLIHK